MSRAAKEMEEGADLASGRSLWQRCRSIDAPEDDAARFLDLAGFADDRLDEEERDRVAALLATDPAAAADVAAARALTVDQASAGLEQIILRACAIRASESARVRVVPFAPWRLHRPVLQNLAQWGSLAAAIVVACWLGFAMGRDASLALSQPVQPSDTNILPELFDPAMGFLRDIGESSRT
jgi:anti-sigma factor RsiW